MIGRSKVDFDESSYQLQYGPALGQSELANQLVIDSSTHTITSGQRREPASKGPGPRLGFLRAIVFELIERGELDVVIESFAKKKKKRAS